MRLRRPRIEPVSLEEYREVAKRLFDETIPDGARVLNISRTWARHPELLRTQRPYQDYLLDGSVLPRREQELAILRMGWRCQSEYEFGQHTVYGKRDANLSDEEIARVIEGPGAPGWTPFEATLLRAVDELYDDNIISDATWHELAEHYDVPQLIEFVTVAGRYWLVSVLLNSTGVQLEADTPGYPPGVVAPAATSPAEEQSR